MALKEYIVTQLKQINKVLLLSVFQSEAGSDSQTH